MGKPTTRRDVRADEWLAAELATGWRPASERAGLLVARIAYLTWQDRAHELDRFFWTEANERLGHAEITAVINRQAMLDPAAKSVQDYAKLTKCVLTAVLIALNERPLVGSAWQGLTWLLCRRAREHETAAAWLRSTDPASLRDHLGRLPGFAFLILAATQDDNVESFLARDAFWDAMLGETRAAGHGWDG